MKRFFLVALVTYSICVYSVQTVQKMCFDATILVEELRALDCDELILRLGLVPSCYVRNDFSEKIFLKDKKTGDFGIAVPGIIPKKQASSFEEWLYRPRTKITKTEYAKLIAVSAAVGSVLGLVWPRIMRPVVDRLFPVSPYKKQLAAGFGLAGAYATIGYLAYLARQHQNEYQKMVNSKQMWVMVPAQHPLRAISQLWTVFCIGSWSVREAFHKAHITSQEQYDACENVLAIELYEV